MRLHQLGSQFNSSVLPKNNDSRITKHTHSSRSKTHIHPNSTTTTITTTAAATTTFPSRMHVETRTDVQIFVKPYFPTDIGTFGLIMKFSNVVGDIILKIQDVTGVPAQHLRLEHGGAPLLDTDRFSDHKIKEGDTVVCLLRNNGGDCECCAEQSE